MSTNGVTYSTKDMNMAAFIWCQEGARLVGVDSKVEKGRDIFFFRFDLPLTHEKLKTLIFDHANDACMVEPNRFCQKQSALRDRLNAARRNKQS